MVKRLTGEPPVANSYNSTWLATTHIGSRSLCPVVFPSKGWVAGGNETDANAPAEGVEPFPTGRGLVYLL